MPPATLEDVRSELSQITSLVRNQTDRFRLLEEEKERMANAISRLQASLDDNKRAAILRSAARDPGQARVLTGKYAGRTMGEMAILNAIAQSHPSEQSKDRIYKEAWLRAIKAALDSTTAAAGDELVPTEEARELWMDVDLGTKVAALIRRIDMPTNPFDIPLEFGDMSFYPGVANVTTKSSSPVTAKRTLTAYELAGAIPLSYDLEEDSAIAVMEATRAHIQRQTAHIIDDIILNADTTVTAGIDDSGTIATDTALKAHWLIGYDGIRHAALVDATGQVVNQAAAPTDAMFVDILQLMGKYGVNPSQVVHVMDPYTYLACLEVTNVRTLDKFGPQATILNGQLAAYGGVPIIVSEEMRKAQATGFVHATAGSNTKGQIITFNRSMWIQGNRREVTIEPYLNTLARQRALVVSFRHALIQRESTIANQLHTVATRNITI